MLMSARMCAHSQASLGVGYHEGALHLPRNADRHGSHDRHARNGTARRGTVVRHGMAWHGAARHGTVRHGTARLCMAWHGTAWHCSAWHATARHLTGSAIHWLERAAEQDDAPSARLLAALLDGALAPRLAPDRRYLGIADAAPFGVWGPSPGARLERLASGIPTF